MKNFRSDSGNVFTVLLAAVALLGLLSFATYNILSGPVATMVRINQRAVAESQMQAIANVIIATAADDTSNGGDCDTDGSVEPAQYVDTAPQPTGGGQIPTGIGVSSLDPWGTEYGYCVWDVGTTSDDAGCGGPSANRLDGDDTPLTVTGTAKPNLVIAVISAGANRSHESTCAAYAAEGTDVLTVGGDDIALDYTYGDASGAGGGLWAIKSSDSDVAEITRDLEITTPTPLSGGETASIGSDATLGLDAVGSFIAVRTDNLYERTASNGVDLHDDVNLMQNGGSDHNFNGLFMVTPKGSPDTLQTTGNGTRMFFYPAKAAFRAGLISGGDTAWDDGNIGTGSAAFGENTQASGTNSFAAGINSTASAAQATAFGDNATASGTNSFAVGHDSTASDAQAFTVGWETTASGANSVAFGYQTTASGDQSFAVGQGSTTAGDNSFAAGRDADTGSSADSSIALGRLITVNGANSVGISLSSSGYTVSDSNTMSIMGGEVGIGTVSPTVELDISGDLNVSGTFSNPSDKRLKDILGPFHRGLDEILQLNPISFRYKKDNPRKYSSDEDHYSLVAQDVQRLIPEAITEAEDGFLHLDMKPVNLAAINAIKTLKVEQDALIAEKDLLKQDLDELKHITGQDKQANEDRTDIQHIITAAAPGFVLLFIGCLVAFLPRRKKEMSHDATV